MKRKKSEGIVVPMITPFKTDGNIDLISAGDVTRYLIDHGCIPFIMGTTGEATSIPANQRQPFVNAVVEAANGDQPVYVGISSNCLKESVQMANNFSAAGANFAVAHLPFYYSLKPYQMKEYYHRLADSIDLPLIVYNISATTHMSIPLDLVFDLSQHPNIRGIKDSEQDLERQEKTIEFCNKQEGFSHFVGWGAQCAYALSIGSDGIVPSTGNLVPDLYKQLYHAAKSGDNKTAKVLQKETDAISAIYQEGRNLSESLAGLKVMMHELELCGKKILPPLLELAPDEEHKILASMKKMNIKEKAKNVK
ncbi:MAG: dihydrodipicolinate synthase family protein [Cyclobacteriaceae bacterium]